MENKSIVSFLTLPAIIASELLRLLELNFYIWKHSVNYLDQRQE